MAAVPGSIPDPSPPDRRHFPGRDHVSEKQTNHSESLGRREMGGICESAGRKLVHSAAGSFVNNKIISV